MTPPVLATLVSGPGQQWLGDFSAADVVKIVAIIVGAAIVAIVTLWKLVKVGAAMRRNARKPPQLPSARARKP